MQSRTEAVRNFFSPLTSQWTNLSKRPLLISKIIIFGVAYTFMIMNSLMNLVQPEFVPECMRDVAHEMTQPVTQYLITHEGFKNALIIISSLMVDICILVNAGVWIAYSKTLRLFFAVITFCAFKILLEQISYFRFPEDYIWAYPGFPSLSMPYYPANDFFFSAQVGLCMICMMNFRAHRMPILKYFALVTVILEFFVLTVTRAHYIIDLITGVVAGHYFYMIGTWIDDVWTRKGLISGRVKSQVEDEPLINAKDIA